MIGVTPKRDRCHGRKPWPALGNRSGQRWLALLVTLFLTLGCGGQKQDTGNAYPGPNSGFDADTSTLDGGNQTQRPFDSLDTGGTAGADTGVNDTAANDTAFTDTVATEQRGTDTSTPGQGSAGQGTVTGDAVDSSASAVTSSAASTSPDESADPQQRPLSLPEGCEAGLQGEWEEGCNLTTYCTQNSDLVLCSRLESGRWECRCNFNNSARIYEVDGTEGLDACAVVSHYCGEDELELSESECEPVGDSSENGCAYAVNCGRTIANAVAPGVQTRITDTVWTSCERGSSTDPFECWCQHEAKETRHGVVAESASHACTALGQFCRGVAATPVEEPETCVLEHELTDSEGCDRLETCSTAVAVVEDVVISDVELRGANCVASSLTTSSCYCSDANSSFSFEVEAPDNTCETTILNCGNGVDIQPLGSPTCAPTSLSTTYASCETNLACTQPATVDGRALTAVGRLLVYCRQEAFDEPWWCSCASDQQSAVFEYGAPDEAPWDVCSAAPTQCLDHLSIHIGPYGEFVPPVDPLSGADVD